MGNAHPTRRPSEIPAAFDAGFAAATLAASPVGASSAKARCEPRKIELIPTATAAARVRARSKLAILSRTRDDAREQGASVVARRHAHHEAWRRRRWSTPGPSDGYAMAALA